MFSSPITRHLRMVKQLLHHAGIHDYLKKMQVGQINENGNPVPLLFLNPGDHFSRQPLINDSRMSFRLPVMAKKR